MNKLVRSVALIVSPLAALVGCAKSGKEFVVKESLEEIRQQVANGEAILVDVREVAEWREGVVDGAVIVSFTELRSDPQQVAARVDLPRDRPLYFYCKAGGRAARAAGMLDELGFQCRALPQGFTELAEAGFATARYSE